MEKNYENIIYNYQQKELKSDRFMNVCKELYTNYWYKSYDWLESYLFTIVCVDTDQILIGKTILERKEFNYKRYLKLCDFISLLNSREIKSNVYLGVAKTLLEKSNKDCKEILDNIIKKSNDFKLDEEYKKINYNMKIPKSISSIIPPFVCEKFGINIDGEIMYADILDNDHINIYKEYNKYVKSLVRLAEDIYLLQMNFLIYKYYSNIFNSSISIKDKEIVVSFHMKKDYILDKDAKVLKKINN